MKKVEARDLDEVSRLCRASEFATSKLLPDGKFLVELMEEGEESGSDPRTVFVARDVSNDQKLAALDVLSFGKVHDFVIMKLSGNVRLICPE